MAEIATIARPYAEALFRVAKAKDATTNLANWAKLLDEMTYVAQHQDVKELVQSPKVSTTMVADTFIALLKSPLTPEARNFIQALADNHRLLLLPEIASQFFILKNAHEGVADAHISSAFELTQAQLTDLCATLEAKFGRKLNPLVGVDPSLIGGVRVAVGDEVLDTSVRARLEQMHTALSA